MTSEIYYTRIITFCLRKLSAKHKLFSILYSINKCKAAKIALLINLFFWFSSISYSFPLEIATCPKEMASCPMEIASCPMEIASCPREMASCPKEMASYPKEMLSCPIEMASCPKEMLILQNDMYLSYIYSSN